MIARFRARFLAYLASLLIGTIPLGAQGVPTGTTLYFPHIANGDTGNGVWTTDLVFVNNSSSITTGQLSLFDDNGRPLSLGTNQGTGSVFSITIVPGGEIDILTDGAGSVAVGWALATFDHAVIGSATFALSTTAAGELVSVGVLSTFPADTFRSPADFQSGIAITNVDSSNTISVTIQALDQNGNLAGSDAFTLAPGQHTAKNLFQFIPTLTSMFVGSIKIGASNASMIALAIGVKPSRNLFVSYALAAIAYNELAANYSGTFNLTLGPNSPASGTVTLTDVEVFDSGPFTATLNINFPGIMYTAPALGNVDPFGLLYSFHFKVPQFPNIGRALAVRQANGSFTGFFVDIGTGDAGTFALNPN
jgi:hypothetical protein